MKEHKNNKKNNFIGGWYMDEKICDELIGFFEENPEEVERGRCGFDKSVHLESKDCFDLGIDADDQRDVFTKYKQNLALVLEQYKNKYEKCDEGQHAWGLIEGLNIQMYPAGGGYPAWHYENSGSGIMARRHLVYMTYLNDITEKGGETEFMYQKVKIKPEKGLTLIWPASWQHTHRGNRCQKQEKYIITGWYSYTEDERF